MKWKNRYLMQYVNTIFSTVYFKLALVMIVCVCIYGGYNTSSKTYIDSLIYLFSNPIFVSFGILIPLLIVSLCCYHLFDKNEYLIIRFQTKKKYLIELLKTLIILNLFIYLLILSIVIISMNIFPKIGVGFEFLSNVGVNSLIYSIFVIVKIFLLGLILMVIAILTCKFFNNYLVISINIILYTSLIALDYVPFIKVNEISNIPIFIGNYMRTGIFDNFYLELSSFLIYYSGLFIFSIILFFISIRKMRGISL